MDKKKINKFVNAMYNDGCAVIVAVGGKGISGKGANKSFAVAGNIDDVITLLGWQFVDLIDILGSRFGQEETKTLLYELVDIAFKENKKSRQPGMADDPKGE